MDKKNVDLIRNWPGGDWRKENGDRGRGWWPLQKEQAQSFRDIIVLANSTKGQHWEMVERYGVSLSPSNTWIPPIPEWVPPWESHTKGWLLTSQLIRLIPWLTASLWNQLVQCTKLGPEKIRLPPTCSAHLRNSCYHQAKSACQISTKAHSLSTREKNPLIVN